LSTTPGARRPPAAAIGGAWRTRAAAALAVRGGHGTQAMRRRGLPLTGPGPRDPGPTRGRGRIRSRTVLEDHMDSPALVGTPHVTVVILPHNRRATALETVRRTLTQVDAAAVTVVDSGSTDGTADALAATYPRVHVIATGRNLGASARNVGVATART